jgi:hypothetical protein
MKKFITLFFLILLTACVSKPLTQFNCDIPEGINYECYSDEECSEYFKGYSAIVKDRFQSYPETTQTIYINVWADHLQVSLLGKIEATKQPDDRIYQKVWTETYDIECNLLEKGYKEGYRVEKI